MTNWGPTGQTVYERTYSRPKPDGSREEWPETVARVVRGNLALVHGEPDTWSPEVAREAADLEAMMLEFKILPAGRHLWASGVPGRQYLYNCHVVGWSENLSDHYQFSFSRLMEGGGVGSNYSTHYLTRYGAPRRRLAVHIVCDPQHPDYDKMRAAGLLSVDYSHEWPGAYPVEDSREGWADALVNLINTFMCDAPVKHENRVFDVSRVRPEGAPLRTFGGTASGPLPFARMMVRIAGILNGVTERGFGGFEDGHPYGENHLTPLEAMAIDHEIGACVVAGGNRRSARMSMVHWADPYVMKFIEAKSDPGQHWTTNISVEIDDEFVTHLRQLAGGAPSRGARNHAERVHKAVVTGMLTNGEPGYWNSSLSNEGEVNRVVATNPCGEIALPDRGACVLGHVNLDAFATGAGQADMAGLAEAHRLMTRFLIRATYGDMNDDRQRAVMESERRIGVGHFGVQGFFAKMGVPFAEVPETGWAGDMLEILRRAVRGEARRYAFSLRIPEPVKVTTVAPTGTVAKLAGRTEGIHPVYARRFLRRVRFSDVDPGQWDQVVKFAAAGHKVERCQYAANTWVVEFPTTESLVAEVEALGMDAGHLVQSADEIPLERMLSMQAFYQERYADNAVSFTVNVPAEPHQAEALARGDMVVPAPSPERVNEVAAELARWLPRLKGTTLMIDGSRPQAPYERLTDAQWAEVSAPVSVADSVDEDCATGACPIK
ncbi:ribonucleoside-triphosphate reductase, adenosylcobalamin-dependent [Micromonospora andamanensis]|uniref:ribonucleoside-triphosphate reductase, adenosylcobalamin-dependent n=1 Tax=Micromonospora andamanensis TaxID=1287068 RepID=UPI001A4077B5|nr:ribonucleoside-triphosphate reductase, adenosylcobalamin-dependent [Micromonospora andamanensis]GIJ38493.1 adenosylcobalamin-dependent ribonucleoside-triphosphate reductase [Micromonospora andamanensis]